MPNVSCPSITSASIAQSGNGFALFGVTWEYQPLESQVVCLQYRVTGDPTWINVNTKLVVDIYGNIENASEIILANAVGCESYDINIFNQCGSLAFTTVFVYPCRVFTNFYLLDNGIYNICGSTAVALYSSEPFAAGVTLYTNVGLTTNVTGYAYVALVSLGNIFALNISTGVVGADSTFSCNSTDTTRGMLSNNSGTICTGAIVDYYSSDNIAVGVKIFTDQALTIAATGFNFFLDLFENIIYNVNNATGVITANSGLSCTAAGNDYWYALTQEDVGNSASVKLYTVNSFGKGAIMYTDYAMTTPLTGYNFISLLFSNTVYTISKTTGEVGCIAVPC